LQGCILRDSAVSRVKFTVRENVAVTGPEDRRGCAVRRPFAALSAFSGLIFELASSVQ
jgi:hypothetical protein